MGSENKSNRDIVGVMFNAYPDSIGSNLRNLVAMLAMPELKEVFSLLYILPTFFNSDLDRGFSIINYDLNKALVSEEDLKALDRLNIKLKFDIVLNHLSVASPQFQDVLKHGDDSKYKDFFINWNEFWKGNGHMDANGVIIPKKEFLKKLFMRKSGLPILKVVFPDGTERPFWNTFYQQIEYKVIGPGDLEGIKSLSSAQISSICKQLNETIRAGGDFSDMDFGDCNHLKSEILNRMNRNRSYLGQMDVNAKSHLVWNFYKETMEKLRGFGGKILRLDAFAYLHKEVGQSNFFNKPGTWDYLELLKQMALKNDLMLLPEIHAEYGLHLHDEVAAKGYCMYDFFLPGLTIHTIENGTNKALLVWINEILDKGYKTVNMLGCHDGIPVLDLKGKDVEGVYHRGLLLDKEIEDIMNKIMERGGRVKNLYDPSGKKISYYQVNATFFSALGEVEQKLLLARAIQMFMPGIPQVWYLDLFAGKNDYTAADLGGGSGHKEINRTNLTMQDVGQGIKRDIVKNQLAIIRMRNTSKAFLGSMKINGSREGELDIAWINKGVRARLRADLKTHAFRIEHCQNGIAESLVF